MVAMGIVIGAGRRTLRTPGLMTEQTYVSIDARPPDLSGADPVEVQNV